MEKKKESIIKKYFFVSLGMVIIFLCGCAPAVLTPPVYMTKWLYEVEQENLGKTFVSDEEKLRFVIKLAIENVQQNTGGPFAAAIFDIKSHQLLAVGINRVVPARQSWAHAEMTAFSRAQMKHGSYELKGCMLVSSCAPCAMCFGATPWSGVEKLVYGAPGEFAERIGFDEGHKVENWHESLRNRGIEVVGPMLENEADVPFVLYKEKSGKVY